jgi:hypothetical protein
VLVAITGSVLVLGSGQGLELAIVIGAWVLTVAFFVLRRKRTGT